MTASATLVAEELEVPVSKIETYQAYKTEFGLQSTGGSTSTRDIYTPIRQAAASAREMLRAAAADEWGVKITECTAKEGAIHQASGQSLPYSEMVEKASQQAIPKSPKLKSYKDFSVIGKGVQRVDALDKCIGKAQFGTDVEIENKVCAYVIRPHWGTGKKLEC